MTDTLVQGPGWVDSGARDYGGLYPLAVERHLLDQVARLLPGVTTVTPHARYFMLHGLVASLAAERGLGAAQTYDLSRRCEVVLAAISLSHHYNQPGAPSAHGANTIYPVVSSQEQIDVAGLAQSYAKASSGFWGPYMASESVMGIIDWSAGTCRPGGRLDLEACRQGLGDIATLAGRETLSHDELVENQHLCLCRTADSPDGSAMLRLLLPEGMEANSLGGRRRQTVETVLRLLDLNPGTKKLERHLSNRLCFGEQEQSDGFLTGRKIHDAWVGVALRSHSVTAWRDLWAHVVGSIEGFMPLRHLADRVADELPDQSLADYLAGLPPTTVTARGLRLPAEVVVEGRATTADTLLAKICIGTLRRDELPDHAASYFEGQKEAFERLSPSWMSHQIEQRKSQSVRDLAAFLTQQMVHRSQQIALTKSTINGEGSIRIPTRVFVRDGLVYQTGIDAGGGVALRWDTLISLLAGLGLTEYSSDGWRTTERGAALCR